MPKTSPKAAPKPVAAKAPAKGDHVFLVDGSSYIFRAYHALPPLNRKSDGLQVNAVLGFCNMLWKLLRDMPPDNRPTHLAIVFDKSEVTFRNKLYPDYKAHRPPAPDDLIPQFALIREAVRAFDLPCLEQGGFEADDLIATYAREAGERGATTTIVSSDKDLMQLVTDKVTMYDTMKDRRIGIPEVIEKFGVPPEKVVEVQALAGDSTDNVPGVPGIGSQDRGAIDRRIWRSGNAAQARRRDQAAEAARGADRECREGADFATTGAARRQGQARRAARRTRGARARRAQADRVPEGDGIFHPDPPRRRIFADRSGGCGSRCQQQERRERQSAGSPPPPRAAGGDLFGHVDAPAAPAPPAARRARLPSREARASRRNPMSAHAALARRGARGSGAKDAGRSQQIPNDPRLDELNAWIARVHDAGHFAIDAKANSIDPMQAEICGIALALAPNDACYIPLAHKQSGDGAGLFDAGLAPDQIKTGDALDALRPLLESAGILKIGFNIKFNAVMLAQHGITMRNHDDAQLMSYALDAGRNAHGLDALAERWLGHATISHGELIGSGKGKLTFDQVAIDKATAYSAEDADVILRLWRVLKPRLVAERMTAVYETLERPLISVLARMERRGISIDRQVLSRLSGEFAQTAARVEAEIQEIAGEPINVGSPKQIGDILFGKMGIPGGTKTKTGAWSTSAQILDELAEQGHEFPKKILEWRQVSKLKSTYTDALPTYVHPQTHRVHTTYALAATTTGRLSSNEPNLQNIPVRTEDGRKIRRAFIASPGHKLVSADYSQIELRLLAEIADIPVLKQAFRDGLDIHAMTASEMFGVPIKDMPSEVRRRAKAINFGIIYGISAFGLANQLGIAREEASAYIKKYFERFPGIRAYMDATRDFCRSHGYVETLFGRKCHYPDIKASNASVRSFNERAAINARLQGTAADIIRRAMIRMEDALAEKKLSAQMLLQVHDELIFEVPDDEVAATLPVVQHVMQDAPFPAVLLSVPLQVDARAADNWDEAH